MHCVLEREGWPDLALWLSFVDEIENLTFRVGWMGDIIFFFILVKKFSSGAGELGDERSE